MQQLSTGTIAHINKALLSETITPRPYDFKLLVCICSTLSAAGVALFSTPDTLSRLLSADWLFSVCEELGQ